MCPIFFENGKMLKEGGGNGWVGFFPLKFNDLHVANAHYFEACLGNILVI